MSSAGHGEPVLRARGIRVVVDGERAGALRRRHPARGLEDFSLDVPAGEVVHLVGDPISGVTEAIEVLSGHPVPHAGRLQVEGRDAPEPGRRARAVWARVAQLGAPPAPAAGRRPVLEVVAEDVRRSEQAPAKSVQREHRERAAEILDAVSVPSDVRTRRERDATGEDLGRVWLARLLAQQPAVVVVPPPGGPAALDVWDELASPELVDSVLARLREESGTAVVRGTDRLPAALDRHERVLVMCGGRVVEVLGADNLAHPLHPWTRALAAGAESLPTRPDVSDPGCPFRARCHRAQSRCTEQMPELTRPLGASHPVACWFPETVRRGAGVVDSQDVLPVATGPVRHGDEPTAHEFVDG